jgi:hypothetical protein
MKKKSRGNRRRGISIINTCNIFEFEYKMKKIHPFSERRPAGTMAIKPAISRRFQAKNRRGERGGRAGFSEKQVPESASLEFFMIHCLTKYFS